MARPREFDLAEALHEAMFLFWRKQYAQTTIRELADAMGIGLPSLYAAFGSKRRLFEEAVALYRSKPEYLVTLDMDRLPAREGIESMLSRAALVYTDPSHPPGCLLITEPRLVAERRWAQQSILEFLGGHEHEFREGTNLEAVAAFYAAVLRGLSAQARDGATRAQLLSVVGVAIAAWPCVTGGPERDGQAIR